MPITKVTLNIETKTYNEFKLKCKKEGLVLSKNIELYMKNFVEKEKNGAN